MPASLLAKTPKIMSAPKAPKFFASAHKFRIWLSKYSASEAELVVGFYKVDSGRPSMSWPQSVDEALCYGWIDGVRKRIDDLSYQVRFTPRKHTSIWSAVNIAKFELLSSQGKMTAAGAAAYAHKTDRKSAVYAYEQAETAQLSSVEIKAFKKSAAAWRFMQNTPPGYQKVVLHWIVTAKKTETRIARFDKLLAACEKGERLR
jgi:uncharacterized protein YdeI (YjbR/CyaY-like superfamily)